MPRLCMPPPSCTKLNFWQRVVRTTEVVSLRSFHFFQYLHLSNIACTATRAILTWCMRQFSQGEGEVCLGMIQRDILVSTPNESLYQSTYHGFINRVSGLVWEDASGEAGDALLHLKRRKEECPNTLKGR